MVDSEQRLFSHHDILELLIKREGIHEGIWSLIIEFKFGATLAGPADMLFPTGFMGVSKIGLQRGAELNNVSLDAAIVNPAPKSRVPKKIR